MKRIRHAIIVGYGSIGRRHARSVRELFPDVEISIVSGHVEKEHLAPGYKVAGSLKAAFKESPDIAIIANSTVDHAEALIAALDFGVPCYVEKPLAANWTQLRQIEDFISRRQDIPTTLVGCNLRFLPSLTRLRELLHGEQIGMPIRASFQVGQWLPDWRPNQDYRVCYSADTSKGGGVVLDLIHELDMCRWLLGEFDHVRALGGHLSQLEIQSEDCAVAILARTGGPVVAVGMDYIARRPLRRYEIVGEYGTLIWDLTSRRLEIQRPSGTEIIECKAGGFDVAATYGVAMRAFCDAVECGRDLEQDIADGLRSLRLALTVRDQMKI